MSMTSLNSDAFEFGIVPACPSAIRIDLAHDFPGVQTQALGSRMGDECVLHGMELVTELRGRRPRW